MKIRITSFNFSQLLLGQDVGAVGWIESAGDGTGATFCFTLANSNASFKAES